MAAKVESRVVHAAGFIGTATAADEPPTDSALVTTPV
jgi:hypothetical protein